MNLHVKIISLENLIVCGPEERLKKRAMHEILLLPQAFPASSFPVSNENWEHEGLGVIPLLCEMVVVCNYKLLTLTPQCTAFSQYNAAQHECVKQPILNLSQH